MRSIYRAFQADRWDPPASRSELEAGSGRSYRPGSRDTTAIEKCIRSFQILIGTLLFLVLGSASARAQTATVTWANEHQTMDGWGAEDWTSAETLTSSQADMFFSPTGGIGLEYIRTGNYGCPQTDTCTVSTSNVPDLATLQAAVARGAKIVAHIVPPAQYQYAGNFYNGTPDPTSGNCILQSNFSAFANWTVQWIQMLNSNGATISVLEVANEPNLNEVDTLGGCVWTAAGLDSYISGYLGPALAAANLTSVQVMLPTVSFWFSPDFVTTCMNDANCSKYVTIVSGHGYWNGSGSSSVDGTGTGYCCATATAAPHSTAGKRVWMDEVNGGFTFDSTAGLWNWDASMADALVWAHSIHDYLTIPNVSAWLYWELADCCSSESGAPFNDGLTQADLSTISKRYYAIGNWSKFVRSGWIRIDATANPQGEIYVTAFKDPSSVRFAFIAVNGASSDVSQTFSLDGFNPTSVTPWVTSTTLNLAQQSDVSVSSGDFTFVLPAQSVTTFVGIADQSSGGTRPASPTQLSATVR